MLNSPKSLRDDDIESMEFLNTIPNLCPNLRKLSLGHRRADWPHSLCSNDVYADNDRQVRSPHTSGLESKEVVEEWSVKEFNRLRMTGQDWHTGCTKQMVYLGLKDGGSGLLIHLCKWSSTLAKTFSTMSASCNKRLEMVRGLNASQARVSLSLSCVVVKLFMQKVLD